MSLYTEKLKGSLLAAALGDALGSFGECMHYRALDRKYPTLPLKTHTGRIPYSDDTALRLVLYDTIISSEFNAFTLAAEWKKRVVDNRIYWTSELYVTSMILTGEDAHRIGHGNILGDNAAMAADPIGMLYPTLDEVAALRAYEAMSLCQSGKGLEGAMAVASAISEACNPNPSIDNVVETARKWVSKDMKQKIDDAVSIALSKEDPRRQFYEEIVVEDGLSTQIRNEINSPKPVENSRRLTDLRLKANDISMGVSPLEVVPVAIGYVARGKKKPIRAIIEAARFGRDCDTISGITGAILGAANGRSCIPRGYLDLLPNDLPKIASGIAPKVETRAKKRLQLTGHSGVAGKLFS